MQPQQQPAQLGIGAQLVAPELAGVEKGLQPLRALLRITEQRARKYVTTAPRLSGVERIGWWMSLALTMKTSPGSMGISTSWIMYAPRSCGT